MDSAIPSLLPPTATAEMRALEQAMVAPLVSLPVETLIDLWNPERCPEWFLPHLAQASRVVLWRSDWPEATRRQMIADSWRINALRGKISGIELALSAIGWPGRVTEWHEHQPERRRGTFSVRLVAGQAGFSRDQLADLHTVIGITARRSQHLDALILPEISPPALWRCGIAVQLTHHHTTAPALIAGISEAPARTDVAARAVTVTHLTL